MTFLSFVKKKDAFIAINCKNKGVCERPYLCLLMTTVTIADDYSDVCQRHV